MSTITHYWDGTVLVITSDSGTSSCDLQGSVGEMGIRGPQGPASVACDTEGNPIQPIVANPELDGTEAELTGLQVNGVKYAVAANGESEEVDLTGYATEEWVENQGYTTVTEVTSLGYTKLSEVQAQGYVTLDEVEAQGYVTEDWVKAQDYSTVYSSEFTITNEELSEESPYYNFGYRYKQILTCTDTLSDEIRNKIQNAIVSRIVFNQGFETLKSILNVGTNFFTNWLAQAFYANYPILIKVGVVSSKVSIEIFMPLATCYFTTSTPVGETATVTFEVFE